MWGAFGNTPMDSPPPPARGSANAPPAARGPQPVLETEGPNPQQFGVTHARSEGVEGWIRLCRRPRQPAHQVFTIDGKYVTQVFVNRSGPSAAGVGGIAFSRDKQQQFMYLADYGNTHLVTVNRKTLDIVGQFGNRSDKPGDFQGVHHIATESKGQPVHRGSCFRQSRPEVRVQGTFAGGDYAMIVLEHCQVAGRPSSDQKSSTAPNLNKRAPKI